MQNPFRSEATAFHFVVAVIVYFGLIVLAGLVGGMWFALAVFIVLSVAALWWLLRSPQGERPTPSAPARRGGPERRILVVANETVEGTALRETIRGKAGDGPSTVYVVSPALNTPVRHWTSDEDGARAAAQERLEASVARLREAGLEADGEIGDGDPLQAIEDALRTFGADEIVISTHPEGRSHWLERGVVASAKERFAVPITHVVVDLESERDETR
jgi:hypothetical protein